MTPTNSVEIHGHRIDLEPSGPAEGEVTDVVVLMRTQILAQDGTVEDGLYVAGTNHTSGMVQLAMTQLGYMRSKGNYAEE